MESHCWPAPRAWGDRCPELVLKRTHFYRGRQHRAGCWPPNWFLGICRDDSWYAKSQATQRERADRRAPTLSRTRVGLGHSGWALEGESESRDLSSVSARIKAVMICLGQITSQTFLYRKKGFANLSPKHEINESCIFRVSNC